MTKRILATLLATSSLSFLLSAKQAQAAGFSLTVVKNVTDSSTPAPGVPNLYVYKNLVSAQGQITAINGFSSLQGVDPSSLSLSFGNLVRTSLTNQNGLLCSTSGNGGVLTPYFNLFENGQVIATSSNIQSSSCTNVMPGSPDYGHSTGTTEITLNGVIGNPFYQEILQLTGGTGILDLTLGSPSNIHSGDPLVGTVEDSDSFTYTGSNLIVGPSAAVPEPSSLLGVIAATGFISRMRRKVAVAK